MTFLDRIKETSTSTGTSTFTLAGAVVGYKTFTNGTYKYCIVNSTETEWEVGEGTVASGVLTRTTIEASSNAGSAVNFSAGTKYVFNTVSAAYVNSLVPYTGATASVNLGEFGLTAGQLTLDTSPTGTAVVGTTQWNDTIGSSQTLLKGGNVLLKNGVDLVARVVNKVSPATTLTKAAYKAVRVSGAQGQRLAIAYAQANNDNNSADTIGLVCETIAANQEGFIITVGQLLDVNTTGSLQGETWADGDVLYLSPTTAGNLTNIKPTGATGHIVIIGYVEYAHQNNGKIYVKIMNGWELDELHNVYISSVANNQVLTYESSTDLWKNKSISTILGYTPQAAITLTTTGTSGASTFVSNTLNIPQYQGALTLTTTGTSGAATLVGNTLNIPQYSGGGISGSGTAGQVTYWSGTSAVTGSANLTYSSGILSNSTSSTDAAITILRPSSLYQSYIGLGGSGTVSSTNVFWSFGIAVGSQNFNIQSYNGSVLSSRLRIFDSTGNVLIQNGGTFTDSGERLQVTGTMKVTDTFTVSTGSTKGISFAGTRFSEADNQTTYTQVLLQPNSGNKSAVFLFAPSGTSNASAMEFYHSSTLSFTQRFVFKNTNGLLQIGADGAALPAALMSNNINYLYMFGNGNVSLQNGGTYTDNGYRLDVNGTGATAGALRVTGGNVQFSDCVNYNDTNKSLNIVSTGTPQTLRGLGIYQHNDGIQGAAAQFYKSRGSSAAPSNVVSGDLVGGFVFNSRVGGAYTSDRSLFGGFMTSTTGISLYFCAGTTDGSYSPLILAHHNGYVGIGLGGTIVTTVTTPTAQLDISASTTSRSSLRIRSGTAPTSPNDGDIWYDGTNIYIRVGGSTKTFTLI